MEGFGAAFTDTADGMVPIQDCPPKQQKALYPDRQL